MLRDHNAVLIERFMGLYQRGDVDNTPLDHFSDCENVQFVGNSSVATRPGIGLSQNVAVPLANIKRIYNYPTQIGNTLIILAIDSNTGEGKVYHMVSATLIYGPILTILGMTDIAFLPYAGRGYISPFNSQSNALDPPATALLATLATGANINTGVHKYGVTFVTSLGETTISPLTTITTNTAGIANPLIAPVISKIGSLAGSNALVPGGTYHWKFVYSADNGATLLTLPGPISNAYVPVNTADEIILQTPSSFPAGAVLVGIYRTVNGGVVYFREFSNIPNGFTFPSNIPTVASGSGLSVGQIDDATLATHPVAPAANNTTTGNVNLSNIPVGGALVLTKNIYRTEANLLVEKLLGNIPNATTVFADTFNDAALGVTAPVVNTALIDGSPVLKGLENEFLYVYAGDGTAARKAAGLAISGSMTIALGSGHTDAGFHIFGIVSETISGYLSPPGALASFITLGTNGVSFGNIPTSGDPNVVRRHLVASKVIVGFNGNLAGYPLFFVPDATINNNTDTFLNNISFYDADLLDDASRLFENYSEIPAGATLSLYHNRLVLGATFKDISIFLVSEPGEPEAINQVDGILIFPLDGNPVSNAQELRDLLYVFKRAKTAVFIDNGDVPSTWPFSIIDNALGTSVHGIATVLDSGSSSVDFLIIATYQGISLFNGKYIIPELSWKIDAYWKSLDRDNFRLIQILNAPIQKEIYIVLPSRKLLVGNYSLGMDQKNIRWAPWSFFPGVNTVAIFNIDEVIIGSDLVT